MLSFIFALLTFLGAFMQGPAMDSDPAPAATASAGWDADTSSDAPTVDVVTEDGTVTSNELDSEGDVVGGTITSPNGDVETFEVEQDCTPWLVPETDEGFARSQELQAAGWAGDPTDGMEALYPPGC